MRHEPSPFRTPRVIRALVVAAIVLGVAYAASTVLPVLRGGRGVAPVWDTGVYLTGFALAIVVCGARAVLVPAERWAWAALTAAIASSMAGDILWFVHPGYGDEVPIPSAADGLYLAFYPLAFGALWGILRHRLPRVGARMWLDGIVSGLAVGSVFAALVVDSVVASTGGSAEVVVTMLLYPLGDLLLLLMVAGVVGLTGGRPGRTWLFFGLGLAIWVVSDTIYLEQTASGTYVEGTLVDAGWPIGMVLLSIAAWRPPQRSTVEPSDWVTLIVPSAATVIAGLVLAACALDDGRQIAVALAGGAVLAAVARTFLSFRDVRRMAETWRLALTDDLTGLPNRRALMQRLNEADASDGSGALVLVDLDHFKELNDTLGHHVGDRLLVEAGRRMADALRPGDTLARLGGDEFAGVLDAADAVTARAVAVRLRDRLEEPFVLDGTPVQVEASVGVALRPDHARRGSLLLQYADVAMYQAKNDRTGVELYAPERNRHSRDRLALVAQLRDGIGRGELRTYLQPQVDARTGELVGVEALVRWEHPERGLLAPGAFLPAVEQTQVMRPLTEGMLHDALVLAVGWRRAGRPLPIAVNVAAPNLLDLGFAGTLARLLAESGAEPEDLRLEITEDGVMVDAHRASAVLEEIRALGVGLAIDDFGTGHSSLARLRHLPVEELKIDRSFVLGMGEDPRDAAIVETAATLGAKLGLRVVAEGVESREAWDVVAAAGCHVIQGFHVARPLPAAEFDGWRARWQGGLRQDAAAA